MNEQHARLRAHAAHRWLRCAGSVEAEAVIPRETSPAAEEGIQAHGLAAGALLFGTPIPPAFEPVERYVNAVRLWATGNRLEIEAKVPIGHITGEAGAEGTADALILPARGDWLRVVDLKYGKGVKVDAEHNEQLMLYALGALELLDLGATPESAILTIVQARVSAPSEWRVAWRDLDAFAERVRAAAEATLAPKPPLIPGPIQCRFCRAKPTCPAVTPADARKETRMTTTTVLTTDREAAPLAAEHERNINGMIAEAAALTIDSQASNQQAANILTIITTRKKAVEETRKGIVDPLNEAVKRVNALFKPLTDRLTEAGDGLKGKMAAWMVAENKRVAEEARRIREAEEVKLRAAAELARADAEAGDAGAAIEVEQITSQAAILAATPLESAAPKTIGAHTRTEQVVEVTDLRALCAAIASGACPAEWVEPNMPKIKAAIKAGLSVPGVTVSQRTAVVSR